jgi:hypothetical protein
LHSGHGIQPRPLQLGQVFSGLSLFFPIAIACRYLIQCRYCRSYFAQNEMRKPLAQPAQMENVPGLMPVGLDAIVMAAFI